MAKGESPREPSGEDAGEDAAPFGTHLRRLREAAGMAQEELASNAGLTARAVSMLERGRRKRPYPHTVRSLADALGLTEAERASLLSSVPRRGGNVAAPDAHADTTLPLPPAPLIGRKRELKR